MWQWTKCEWSVVETVLVILHQNTTTKLTLKVLLEKNVIWSIFLHGNMMVCKDIELSLHVLPIVQ
jgi:hypothetical protein